MHRYMHSYCDKQSLQLSIAGSGCFVARYFAEKQVPRITSIVSKQHLLNILLQFGLGDGCFSLKLIESAEKCPVSQW